MPDHVLSSLLSSKLRVPSGRQPLVSRPRLLQCMDEAVTRRLTLVAASAGFGKTTLIGEWIGRGARHAAWVTLDQGDNDPARFWAYVVAALEGLQPGVGANALALLDAGQARPLEEVLTALINALADFPWDFYLVLDDYHAIESQQIHNALTFLINYLPPRMHVIVATRVEPPLPLARWRARGEMAEIRTADLRFTIDEVTQFLAVSMKLQLPAEQAAALESSTEGWIAGLQLVALALRTQDPQRIPELISRSASSHRYVFDYLFSEVLQAQDPSVQTFLRRTAILQQLTASLCDAVTGRSDSQAILDYLERAELFLLRLDAEGQWYRYHNSFASVLQKVLGQTEPDLVPELHRRAAAWYQEQHAYPEAVRHSLLAGDMELAAALIDSAGAELLDRGEIVTLRDWLAALPRALVRAHVGLSIYYLLVNLLTWHIDDLRIFLAELEQQPPREAQPGDDLLRGIKLIVQALLAAHAGDKGQAIELAQLALDGVSGEAAWLDLLRPWVGGLRNLLGGETEAAYQSLSGTISTSQAAGHRISLALSALVSAWLAVEHGQLGRAAATCRRAITLLSRGGPADDPNGWYLQLEMATVLRFQGDLAAAERCLSEGLPTLRRSSPGWILIEAHVVLAWTLQGLGDTERADAALRAAEQLCANLLSDGGNPNSAIHIGPWAVARVHANQAQMALARGDVEVAAQWADEYASLDEARGLGPVLFGLREGTTWPWLLISQGRAGEAASILERLLAEPWTRGRYPFQIHGKGLLALAWRSQGDAARAQTALAEALELAEPEGYLSPLLDLGRPMVELLAEAVDNPAWAEPRLAGFARKLIAQAQVTRPLSPLVQAPEPGWAAAGLVEPLSPREIEVLGLLAQGLSNQEIAERLFLGITTVKTHVHNIYGKLSVEGRRQAVARAHELRILS